MRPHQAAVSGRADVVDALAAAVAWQPGLKPPALQSVNIWRKTKEGYSQNLCWIDQLELGRGSARDGIT